MNTRVFANPKGLLNEHNSFKESLKELFVAFGFLIIVSGCFSFFMLVADLIIVEKYKFSFLETIKNLQKERIFPVVFVILVGPFLEELMFRLPLVINRNNITISISVAIFYFCGDKISELSLQNIDGWLVKIGIIFLFLIIHKYLLKEKFLNYINEKFYTLFFYSTIIVFGLLHISNFIHLVPNDIIIFSPIFVLPQIILGFFISYLRIKNGFIWGLFFHCFYNALSYLIY